MSSVFLTVTSDQPSQLDAKVVQQHVALFYKNKVRPIIANNTKLMLHWDGENLDTLFIRSLIPNDCSLVPNSCIFDPSKINVKNVVLPSLKKPSPPFKVESIQSADGEKHELMDETPEDSKKASIPRKKTLKELMEERTKLLPKIQPKPPPPVSSTITAAPQLISQFAVPQNVPLSKNANTVQRICINPQQSVQQTAARLAPMETAQTRNDRTTSWHSLLDDHQHPQSEERPPRSASVVSEMKSEVAFALWDQVRKDYPVLLYADEPEEENEPKEEHNSDGTEFLSEGDSDNDSAKTRSNSGTPSFVRSGQSLCSGRKRRSRSGGCRTQETSRDYGSVSTDYVDSDGTISSESSYPRRSGRTRKLSRR